MSEGKAYLRPKTLDEALAALDSASLTVAAGCTDLLAATERKRLPGDVLDITAIPELRGIENTADGVRIGATTSWSALRDADLPPAFHGLQLAAREVGARQIQNRGTIAGNLCNASPAADGVPPLLTLDAEVELASASGTRRLPLSKFLTGPRQTARAPNELLTALHIPEQALNGQGHFLKLGAREYLVISIAMCAVRICVTDGVISQAALAIGACGPVATRLLELESTLIGRSPETAHLDANLITAALSPIDDARADATYRSHAACELLRRCFAAALPKAQAA